MNIVRIRGLRDLEHPFIEYKDALAYASGKADSYIKVFHGKLVSKTKNYWKIDTSEGSVTIQIITIVG